MRNLYKRKVNQLVSIFSATDSVLEIDMCRGDKTPTASPTYHDHPHNLPLLAALKVRP